MFYKDQLIFRESSSCDDNIDPQLVYCTHVRYKGIHEKGSGDDVLAVFVLKDR